MELALFGDIFINIRRFLRPVDLYMLSTSCKHYQQTITQNVIKRATINEINRRIDDLFGNEFMQLLRDGDAVITGSFIEQCMLGETWKDSPISIGFCSRNAWTSIWNASIMNGDDSWDAACKYMEKYIADPWDISVRYNPTLFYRVRGIQVELALHVAKIDMPSMYRTTSDKVVVVNMHDVFAKRARICSTLCATRLINWKQFSELYRRRFTFYDNNGITLTDTNCYRLLCKTVRIVGKRKRKESEDYVNRGNFVINGNVISGFAHGGRGITKAYPLFSIDTKSQYYSDISKLEQVRISKCKKDKKECITYLLYPSMGHYHCDGKSKDEYILIPSYP